MAPLVFVFSTKADRKDSEELVRLIESALKPSCDVTSIQWPTEEALPWLGRTDEYAIVIPVTRAALTREKGWPQALTSHQVDTKRSIAIFLYGLDAASQRDVEFRSAQVVNGKSIADASGEILTALSAVLGSRDQPTPDRVGLDTRHLLGREADLAAAVSMAAPPTKSIAIVGLGGQGKTSLAAALSDKLVHEYVASGWVSLRNAPTLDWVAQQVARQLGADISVADATAETATNNILAMLSARRVLLVLDNAETVFSNKAGGALAENAQDLSSHYEHFFRSIAEARHDSLVVVTSRELPTAYRLFPSTMRVLRLPGLSLPAVQQLVEKSGVQIAPEVLTKAHARFLGNPLAVKLLCGLYLDRGTAATEDLLAAESPVMDDISTLMDEHVARLSSEGRFILSKLAWEGGSVESASLPQLAWPVDSRSLQAQLGAFARVLLVESDHSHTSISHPLLREHLVEEIKREVRMALLLEGDHPALPRVLSTMLLVNPKSDDYVQTLQVAAVENLVADLRRQLGTKHKIRTRILGLLDLARKAAEAGYAVANLVEIARRVGVDLRDADFSSLPLDCVDFRDIDVRGASCSGSSFRACVFGDNFGPVTAVARVVDDGRELIAAGTFEGLVRLWTSDGELHSAVKCADDWISAITPVTENGDSYFAAVDGTIGRVSWSTLSVETIVTVDAQVRGLALLADSLVAACADGSIRILELATAAERRLQVADFRLKVVRALRKGSESPRILLGGDSRELLFVDGASGDVSRITNGGAWVRDAVFDAAGQTLYTADDDGRVRAWAVTPGGAELRGEAGHSHRVWSLALDEESSRLFSAGNDSVIRVWDVASMKQLDLYEGHGSWVRAMSLVDHGRVLVSGSEDQTLRFWRTDRGRCFRRRTGYARRVFALGFGSEQVLVCGTGDHKLVKFDLNESKVRTSYFEGHRDQVFSLSVERQSNRVASASDDGEVRVSDLTTGDTVFAERLHTGWIGAVAFSPSGLRLVSGADDRTMVVLDAVHFTTITRRRTHEGRISSIVFASEEVIVCSSEDGTVRTIELPTLRERGKQTLSNGPLYAVGLVAQGAEAVAAGVGGKVWRISLDAKSAPAVVAELPVNAIWSIDVRPDGEVVALGADDGSLVLLKVKDGSIISVANAHQRQVWCVRWSPSGDLLATASEDGQVALWNADGTAKKRLAPPLLYQGLRIGGAEGLSPAERRHLLMMGATQ